MLDETFSITSEFLPKRLRFEFFAKEAKMFVLTPAWGTTEYLRRDYADLTNADVGRLVLTDEHGFAFFGH